MKKLGFLIFLVCFLSVIKADSASAEPKSWKLFPPSFGWSKNHENYRSFKQYNPYLEDARHLQIPQWKDENWYVEDWASQKDAMTLIKGWYSADIIRDQKVGHANLPVLVVGPNFYRLSGFDKRRVVTTINVAYGIVSDQNDGKAFMLTDWYTKKPIGVFDNQGLRLH